MLEICSATQQPDDTGRLFDLATNFLGSNNTITSTGGYYNGARNIVGNGNEISVGGLGSNLNLGLNVFGNGNHLFSGPGNLNVALNGGGGGNTIKAGGPGDVNCRRPTSSPQTIKSQQAPVRSRLPGSVFERPSNRYEDGLRYRDQRLPHRWDGRLERPKQYRSHRERNAEQPQDPERCFPRSGGGDERPKQYRAHRERDAQHPQDPERCFPGWGGRDERPKQYRSHRERDGQHPQDPEGRFPGWAGNQAGHPSDYDDGQEGQRCRERSQRRA